MANGTGTVGVPIEELADPVVLVDDSWRIVGNNAAGQEFLGPDGNQYLGQSLDDVLQFTDPDTGAGRQPSTSEPPASGCELDGTGPLVIENDNGSAQTMTLRVIPTDDTDGTAALLLFRPVDTENDRQQRRRQQREALYELSVDETVTGGEFVAALETITETAADVLQTTWVSIWLFDESGDEMRCLDRYDRRSGDHTFGETLGAERYPAYFEALGSNRMVAVPDAKADPRTAGLVESYLEPKGITSMLDATLRDGGDVVGVVCHEQADQRREWTDDEIGFAGNIADLVHRTFRRQERERNRTRIEFRQSLLKAQQEAVNSPRGQASGLPASTTRFALTSSR